MTSTTTSKPEEKEDSKYDPSPEVKRFVSWINVLYGVIFIFIGLPVWWRTTTIYRAWLPHGEIASLNERPVIVMQHVEIISCDPWTSSSALQSFETQLMASLAKNSNGRSDRVQIQYIVTARECTSQETEILRTATSLEDFEVSLEPVRTFADKDRTLSFLLLPNNTRLLEEKSSGLLKMSGITYLRVKEDVNQLSSLIQLMLSKVLVVDRDIVSSFDDVYRAPNNAHPDKLRQLPSAASYEVVFNLLNARPETLAAKWDMPRALRFFADPFASKIGRYISLSFKSQFLYYIDIPVTPRKQKHSFGTYYKHEDLPHLLNPIERYLTDGATAKSSLQFVVYIPPESQHPLVIGDMMKNGSAGACSFLSPRWGGVMIYNVDTKGWTKTPVSHEMDMRKVMAVFMAQLRSLLGVSRKLPSLMPMEPSDDSGVTSWELQSWLRRRAVEQIATASMTLASLSDLLGKVGNMVIQDNIADEVIRSVDALKIAHEHFAQGAIHEAFAASKQALLAAERAFFDPSLLELLYFSDDQKYAVYVPLFLPIAIPMLLGCLKSVRFLLKERSSKKVLSKED